MEGDGNSVPENPIGTPERKQGDEPATQEQAQGEAQVAADVRTSRRTPFANLSQVDADLVLARRLQEQERAYVMLSMNNRLFGGRRNYFRVVEEDLDDFDDAESVNDDEDASEDDNTESVSNDLNVANLNISHDVDSNTQNSADSENERVGDNVEDSLNVHNHRNEDNDNVDYEDEDDEDEVEEEEEEDEDEENDDHLGVEFDPDLFPTDEAYARALQDHEERELIVRIADLISEVADHENTGGISQNLQDMWEELDPDELSYEELLALGEAVGTESRGLSADTIASLPSIDFKPHSTQTGTNDSCVICRLDYETGETVTVLSCKHSYHPECINDWLKIKKVCPVCSTEVSTSERT